MMNAPVNLPSRIEAEAPLNAVEEHERDAIGGSFTTLGGPFHLVTRLARPTGTSSNALSSRILKVMLEPRYPETTT